MLWFGVEDEDRWKSITEGEIWLSLQAMYRGFHRPNGSSSWLEEKSYFLHASGLGKGVLQGWDVFGSKCRNAAGASDLFVDSGTCCCVLIKNLWRLRVECDGWAAMRKRFLDTLLASLLSAFNVVSSGYDNPSPHYSPTKYPSTTFSILYWKLLTVPL